VKKYLLAPVCVAAALLGSQVGCAALKPDPWRSLLHENSLAGWRSMKSETPGAGWTVDHGVLTSLHSSGDLVTADEFGDFELSLEWKISKGGNSGVFYRVNLAGGEDAYETGPEFQILDNLRAEDRQQPNHRAGSLYDLVAPSKETVRPADRWNQARIIVRGWKVEHWLNGPKIVDVDLASPDGQALISHSKFANAPQFASFKRGHIVLQDHGNIVSFRRIKIRDLGAE
jgi:3-keto-disaccharide hydrolase